MVRGALPASSMNAARDSCPWTECEEKNATLLFCFGWALAAAMSPATAYARTSLSSLQSYLSLLGEEFNRDFFEAGADG